METDENWHIKLEPSAYFPLFLAKSYCRCPIETKGAKTGV